MAAAQVAAPRVQLPPKIRKRTMSPLKDERGPATGPNRRITAPNDSGQSTTRSGHRKAPPTVLSSVVHLANKGKVRHTVGVHHDLCNQMHLHYTQTLEPFERRALCGRGSYLVVPLVQDIPFGRDFADADLWCDRDGTVRHEDGSVHVPAQRRPVSA